MNRRSAIFLTIITSLLLAIFFVFPAWTVLKQAFAGQRADGTACFTLEFLGMVLRNPIYQEGLVNALLLGVASTVASLLIAMPLALVSQRFEYPGKSVLGVLVLAPLILPPFVGAVGIKQILGSQGALNALLVRLGAMDAQLPYDWLAHGRFGGIIAMNALHLYPILYLNIAAALAKLDPALEQAAHNLGCAPWKRFWRITLPLTMPGVFAGAAIVFIWAFTELGVPLVFDYARVAPVQIFDGIKGLDKNPLPYALSAILLLIAMVVFGLSKWAVGSTRLGAAPRPHPASQSRAAPGRAPPPARAPPPPAPRHEASRAEREDPPTAPAPESRNRPPPPATAPPTAVRPPAAGGRPAPSGLDGPEARCRHATRS